MADEVWKGVYPMFLLNRFFDPSTLYMRKGRDIEKTGGTKTREKKGGGKKRIMKIVAATSLPAVNHPNAKRWNAARLCQFQARG